ncbi:MAG: MurT ligase domain-containing protein [Erysipelotrichaceae bacterium]|nr:MurT ligase domain-containing protein [Erysipelotrichaceae bacterium]
MASTPRFITLLIAKSTYKILRLLGKNSSVFSGAVALKLDKDILGKITPPKHLIMVSGTNGKTSTTNLLKDSFLSNGYSVIDNHLGSNILTGITSSLINNCDLNGVCHQDIACLELDERSARTVFPYLTPEYLIVSNIQRDTMLRNPHTEYIFDIINKYLPKQTKLILNADDLISSQLGKDNDKVFYKVEVQENEKFKDNIVKDITVCPKCHSELKWKFVRYNSIGQGYCPNCDFKSSEAQYIAISNHNNQLQTNVGEYPLVGGNRIIDMYNEISIIALLKEFGLTDQEITKGLKDKKIVASRYLDEKIADKTVISMLAKGMNAIACSNSFETVSNDKEEKSVLMILDDEHENRKSSEIVSWIYDTDFEFLKDPKIKQIVVGGKRSYDYKVRLLLAGVDENKIICSLDEIKTAELLDLSVDKIYILWDMYNTNSYKGIKETLHRRLTK